MSNIEIYGLLMIEAKDLRREIRDMFQFDPLRIEMVTNIILSEVTNKNDDKAPFIRIWCSDDAEKEALVEILDKKMSRGIDIEVVPTLERFISRPE